MNYKLTEHNLEHSVLHIPEGVRDVYNGDCSLKLTIEENIHQVFKQYGFHDIQTPMFEFFDVFNKERGTIPSREMFKFFDRYGNTLVLRPDMTPAVARCVGKYFKEEELPMRLCYMGSTFINNTSYQGKLKETTQLGGELVNDATVDADAEMIALTIEALKSAGLTEFQVEIGHADFLLGLLEEADFDEEETEQLRILIEEKNVFGVEDIVSNKEMPANLKELILKIPDLFGNLEEISYAKNMTSNQRAIKAFERLEELYSILDSYGLSNYVSFDLGLLSKYNYYTGILFKAYTYGTGEPVAKGGRYDNLIRQFGKVAPSIGVAIEIDQLMIAYTRQKKQHDTKKTGVSILYLENQRADAVSLAGALRAKGEEVQLVKMNENYSVAQYVQHANHFSIGTAMVLDNKDTVKVIQTETKEETVSTLKEIMEG